MHQELKRKGVTLLLLWQEYKAQHSDGFQYSRFCDLHRDFTGALSVSMRQTHLAGEKLFVDYAGPTIDIVERWIMAVLRNRTFFSLAEANTAIAKLLPKLNNHPFRKLPGCRRSQFERWISPL